MNLIVQIYSKLRHRIDGQDESDEDEEMELFHEYLIDIWSF